MTQHFFFLSEQWPQNQAASFQHTAWFIGIPLLDYYNTLKNWIVSDPQTHQATGVDRSHCSSGSERDHEFSGPQSCLCEMLTCQMVKLQVSENLDFFLLREYD